MKTGATLDKVENAPTSVEMAEITSGCTLDKMSGLDWTPVNEGIEEFDVQSALESEEEVLDFLAEALEGDGFDTNLVV